MRPVRRFWVGGGEGRKPIERQASSEFRVPGLFGSSPQQQFRCFAIFHVRHDVVGPNDEIGSRGGLDEISNTSAAARQSAALLNALARKYHKE